MKRTLLGWLMMLMMASGLHAAAKPRVLARIPFDMVGTYVVMDVKINENPPLKLLLDSGIGATIITELTPGDSLFLDRGRQTILKGLGSGEDIQAWVSEGNTLVSGKMKIVDQTIMILERDVFNLSMQTGSKVNGILGADFFDNQIVQVDYSRNCVYLYQREGFVPPKGFQSIPIQQEGYKMFLEVPIQDASNRVRRVRMLIDTGAELTAWFRSYGLDPIPIPSVKIRGYIGRGLSGDIEGSLGKLSKIWIGDHLLSDLVVAYPDSVSIAGTSNNSQRDGTIGSQLLCRFDLIFDKIGGMLYVRPNHFYKKPFQYNMAGIEVIKDNESLRLPEVLTVWENSPGQLAGVRAGDFIMEINGTSGFLVSVNEIKNTFETRSKSPVHLLLLRDGKPIHVRVKLRNMLE